MRHLFWISAALLTTIIGTAFWPGDHEAIPPTSIAPSPPSSTAALSKLIPASTVEVKSALERIFGDAVVLSNASHPVFESEDLNGDGVDDLVVMVTVASNSVPHLNGEPANWSVQDVRKADLPSTTGRLPSAKKSRARVHANQPVLAVIHGYGERAWRSQDARQAFLLVNTETNRLLGVDFERLKALGVSLPRMSANPREALVEKSGADWIAVYWTGAQYGSVILKRPRNAEAKANIADKTLAVQTESTLR